MQKHYTKKEIIQVSQFLGIYPIVEPTFDLSLKFTEFQKEFLGLVMSRSTQSSSSKSKKAGNKNDQDLYDDGGYYSENGFDGPKEYRKDSRYYNYSNISYKEIRNISKRHGLTHYIEEVKDLQRKGVLDVRRPYSVEEGRPFGYKLTRDVIRGHKTVFKKMDRAPSIFKGKAIRDRAHVRIRDDDDAVNGFMNLAMSENFGRLRFRKDFFIFLEELKARVLKGEVSVSKFVNYKSSIKSMVTGEFWATSSEIGRIYSSITNMSKDLRHLLEINYNGSWVPIVELDVSACYPHLLVYYYDNTFGADLTVEEKFDLLEKEKEDYISFLKNNDFYESLMKDVCPKRSDQKVAFSSYLNGSNKKRPIASGKALRKRFPILGKTLDSFLKSHSEEVRLMVGRDLFKLESDIMIKDVYEFKRMLSDDPVITIHDAVLTVDELSDEYLSRMQKSFQDKIGIIPTIIKKPYD